MIFRRKRHDEMILNMHRLVLIRARRERASLGYITHTTRDDMAKFGLTVSEVERFLNVVGE